MPGTLPAIPCAHQNIPSLPATLIGRRLNSIAFNLTGADTSLEMGPLEIAPGTQWDDLTRQPNDMFPPRSLYPRYGEHMVRKLPQRGDISKIRAHDSSRHGQSGHCWTACCITLT